MLDKSKAKCLWDSHLAVNFLPKKRYVSGILRF